MKVLCSVILLLGAVASSHGYSYLIPARQNQGGVCYFNGHVLPKGDTQMPTACQSLHCNDDGSILVQGCGRLNIKNCTLLGPTKNAASYPDCCEMNYQCRDSQGRVYMKQWNQLKDKDISGDQQRVLRQNAPSNQQQTSEAINAVQELLDQVRQQAQRDGRFDLNSQSDRVESELLILRQIVDQQAQQQIRGPLVEVNREAQDQERRIQLARMEEELNTLVKMSKGMVRFSEEERLKDEVQVAQEVKAISELIQNELATQGRVDSLKPQFLRFEEQLQNLAQLKARQAQQVQQGALDQAKKEQQAQQIAMQAVLVAKELNTLLRMWAQGADQTRQDKALGNIVEKIQRQLRLQSPEVRAQLSRVQNELEILSQMESAQSQSQAQQGAIAQAEQAIKAQRERFEKELQTLVQKWTQEVDGSVASQRLVRLIREEISRLFPQQFSAVNGQLNRIDADLQTLQRINIIQDQKVAKDQQQDPDIRRLRKRVEEELRDLLKRLVQKLRQVRSGSEIEQDVLVFLKHVQIQRGEGSQNVDQIQGYQQGIPGQVEWQKQEQLGSKPQFQQLIRTFLNYFGDQIKKQQSVYTPSARVQVNRVQNELQILSQIRARQAQLYEQGRIDQAQEQQMKEQLVRQKEQFEKEMAVLVQKMAQGQDRGGIYGIQDPVKQQLQSVESQTLKYQADRIYEDLKIYDQIKAQQGQGQGQEQKLAAQRVRIQRELKILFQMWSVGMDFFDERDLIGEFGQDARFILNLVGDLLRNQDRSQFPKLSAKFNRIEEGVKYLDQRKALQVQGTPYQAQRQQQEIEEQRQQVESDLLTLLQILTQEVRKGDQIGRVEPDIQIIVDLQRDRIRDEGRGKNVEILAQINSIEEELRILAQIDARQVRQALEGQQLYEGQQKDEKEIQMQLNRLNRVFIALLKMLSKPVGEVGRFQEEALAVLADLFRNRIQRQAGLQTPELRAKLSGIEEKMRNLAQIKIKEGSISDVQKEQEIRVKIDEVEQELKTLLQLIGQVLGVKGQIEEEAAIIMELVKKQIQKQGRRQSREGNQLDVQMERVEMELKALDQLNIRQAQLVQRGFVSQTEQRQQKEEKQLQREKLEKELKTLLDIQKRQYELDSKPLIGVKVFKNQPYMSPECERIEKELQTLQQLKARQSKVSGGERQELEQEIDAQRDRIERELRTFFEIKAKQAALEGRSRQEYEDSKEGRGQDRREDRLADRREDRLEDRREDRLADRRADRLEDRREDRLDRQGRREDRRQERRQDRLVDRSQDRPEDRPQYSEGIILGY